MKKDKGNRTLIIKMIQLNKTINNKTNQKKRYSYSYKRQDKWKFLKKGKGKIQRKRRKKIRILNKRKQ